MDAIEKRRLSAHLIGPGDLNLGWIPLYLGTFALQFLCGWLRAIAAALVLLLVQLLTIAFFDLRLPVKMLGLAIGFGPLVISLATLVLPLGGWWVQQQEGGRRPSEREQAIFDAAFEQLRSADPELRAPHRWFVLESPEINASAFGNTLMVTRGLLDSYGFVPALAHELGHLNSSDARVSAAVYRLMTPPREPLGKPLRMLGWLISGRAAMDLMRTPWAMYWRRREMVADAYAAKLGQGPQLAAFLDTHVLDDMPTPFKSFGASSHPWTEHRVDGLESN